MESESVFEIIYTVKSIMQKKTGFCQKYTVLLVFNLFG